VKKKSLKQFNKMKNIFKNSLVYLQFLTIALIIGSCNQSSPKLTNNWKSEFEQKLPLLGHRNWILVVDKAFPLQSAPGMTVINTGEQLPAVLQVVMGSVSQSTHVKPIVFTDSELNFIAEDMSPGVDTLKKSILSLLKSYEVKTILHNDVFAKLDSASKLFNVVVLKTESTVPYSSVFIQLDCAYWDSRKEMKLREKMEEKKK
jgi:D-ribose pyranose/furanose isomerase RbsD